MPDDGRPARVYTERRGDFEDRRDRVLADADRTARWRLWAFFLGVGAFLVAERVGSPWAPWSAGCGVAALVAFFALVARHRRQKRDVLRCETLVELNEEALARLDRRWEDLPPAAEAPDLRLHPYAEDLDVVGPESLERLLSPVGTGPGARTLRGWLLAPAPSDEVKARRMAVEELAGRLGFRQELAARARLAGLGRDDPTEGFLHWSEEPSWLGSRRWLLWAARIAPAAIPALVALELTGAVSGPWWLLGLLPGIGFQTVWTAPIGAILERMSGGRRFLGSYGACFEHMEGLDASAPFLAERVVALTAGGTPASAALRRLDRWTSTSDVRFNHLIHVPLQILFFWDVHVLHGLERWREDHGSRVGQWLKTLGVIEALSALAALRFDHPEWCFADVVEEERVEAAAMGHPLIPAAESVENDVELGPAGTFLLVTGSNMSGKSTLLRSVGLNCVLGLAGGPVCARSFRMPRVRVVTSMRTEDSLARGISTFMAELERVSFIVETARASEVPVLYLMDEPLQGTNEAERRTAVRIVLEHLLSTEAIGAISTHDLLLHETERLRLAAHPVHFTSSVEPEEEAMRLTFDYRLRPGPATSTNALDLLRLVGLHPEDRA